MRNIPKKLLILIALFVIILIVLIISIFINTQQPPDSEVTPTPAISGPVIPGGSITPLPVTETGATNDSGLSPEEENVVNLKFKLRERLPVETDAFTLEYNYTDFYFMVFLQPPYQESINAFSDWLEQNGYADIPREEFIFESL